MQIRDCEVGMKVRGTNMFGLVYTITKVNKTTVHVSHETGDKVMRGGRFESEVFHYKNVKPSVLTPV